MSRTLSGSAQTERAKNSSEPINLLVIELTGGTVYYSDRAVTVDAQAYTGKVLSWGSLSYATAEDGHASTVLRGITLSDVDMALLASLQVNQWQKITTKVYQWWAGLVDADKVLLLEGILTGPLNWQENERTVSFDVIDVAREWDRPVGTLATRAVCPKVAPEDEGKMIPIVYGEGVKRVKAIAGLVGRKGRLLRDCDVGDTTLYIEGWEDVTPGTTLTLRIGDEILEGDIDGTELTNVTRGKEMASGRTTAAQSGSELESTLTDLTGFDGEYIGLWLRVNVPNTSLPAGTTTMGTANVPTSTTTEQNKRIIAFDNSTGRITWEGAAFFQMASAGQTTFFGTFGSALGLLYPVPEGKQIAIISIAAAHSAGEEIVEHQTGGVYYIVADHAIQRIRGVWVQGEVKSTPGANAQGQQGSGTLIALAWSSGPAMQQNTPAAEATKTVKDSWRKMSTLDYQVALNDSGAFPDIDHNVAVIKMPMPPTYNRKLGAKSDEIWVDIDGVEDGGNLVQHPIDIINDLMDTRFGLSSQVDTSISGVGQADKTRHLRCRFAMTEQRPLIDMCSHLAFLAAGRLYVTDDAKMATQYLTHWGDATVTAVSDSKIALDSPIFGWREYEQLVTRIRYSFQEQGHVRHDELDDTVQQATYGVRAIELDLSWLGSQSMADWVAQRWLDRRKYLNQVASVSSGLQAIELQVGDQIDLAREGMLDTTPAQIEIVDQQFGDGANESPDMVRYGVRLPLWAGCTTDCESLCQTGCESQCQAYCQTTCETGCEESCQTACQDVCEMACETALEVLCFTGCMTSCTWGCEIQCTGSNMNLGFACGIAACQTVDMAACKQCTMPAGCATCCEPGDCQTSCMCGCTIFGEDPLCGPECAADNCDLTCQAAQVAGTILCENSCMLECQDTGCENEEVCVYCCMAECTVISGECV